MRMIFASVPPILGRVVASFFRMASGMRLTCTTRDATEQGDYGAATVLYRTRKGREQPYDYLLDPFFQEMVIVLKFFCGGAHDAT
jgi:hypothetical protein